MFFLQCCGLGFLCRMMFLLRFYCVPVELADLLAKRVNQSAVI